MSSNVRWILVVVAVATIIKGHGINGQRYEGDGCTLNGVGGVCRFMNQCPAAITALQQMRQRPQICGFSSSSSVPIVCCVGGAPAAVTTPSTTTARSVPAATSAAPVLTGNKAYDKCVEYSAFVYEEVIPLASGIGTGQKVRVNRCGHTAAPLVVGGEDAKPMEFPHMARLGMGEENAKVWTCGGTLISDYFVLTAGHCLYSPESGNVKWVRVGDLDFGATTESAEPQDFSVAEIIKHPEYKPPSRYNDIALLRLDRRVRLNKYVIPACIRWDTNPLAERKAIATGWGKTDYTGDTSDKLQKVTLELFAQDECNTTYAAAISARRLKFGIVPQTQLCAGSHTEEKDTCQGDSGGPLQVYVKDNVPYCMYSLVGVTSFGSACGLIGSPGVYTRVSNYSPWIISVVWP